MKRKSILTLALLMAFGMFSACGGAGNTATTPETTETPTQPGEEGKTLKILTLGHSLAVDCGHMLARVAAAEGYENFKVGTLYYSGCRLSRHVEHLTQNKSEYDLFLSSTDDPDNIPAVTYGVTMEYALRLDYWDIIIMQGNPFEIAANEATIEGDIKTIQNYVREKCLNPNVKFAWHMDWATPTDNDLRDTYTLPGVNPYYKNYEAYGDDRTTMYKSIVNTVQTKVVTNETFQFVIPTATAMENALSSYLEEKDIHRDYSHATDMTRVMNSYVWFCRVFGIEQLNEIKMDTIPVKFFRSTKDIQDRVLTEAEKAIILESVNNALKTPFAMTQSQYTTAP